MHECRRIRNINLSTLVQVLIVFFNLDFSIKACVFERREGNFWKVVSIDIDKFTLSIITICNKDSSLDHGLVVIR